MKGNNLSKILSIFIAVIALIGAILFVRVFMADVDAIETDPEVQGSVVSPLVYFSTFLLYAAIGVTVVLSLWTLIRNPESLKRTLLGLGVLGVLLIVAYFFADSLVVMDGQGKVLEGGEAGAASNQWASTGIRFSLILLAIAGAFFVFDLVKGLIKS